MRREGEHKKREDEHKKGKMKRREDEHSSCVANEKSRCLNLSSKKIMEILSIAYWFTFDFDQLV